MYITNFWLLKVEVNSHCANAYLFAQPDKQLYYARIVNLLSVTNEQYMT